MASAIAGRPLSVAPLEPGAPSWTDGTTVFIDPAGEAREQIRALAVQASLLSAGSLGAEYVEALIRRPALTQRYLTVEGHRALAAHEALLPVAARLLIDPQLAARTGSPGESLTIALSRHFVADPPDAFGTIRPRRLRPEADVQRDTTMSASHVPRQSGELLQELDDDEDDGGALFDTVSSPVGGGGGIGRLIKRLLGDAALQRQRPARRRRRNALVPSRPWPFRSGDHDDVGCVSRGRGRRHHPARMDLSRVGRSSAPLSAGLVHRERG